MLEEAKKAYQRAIEKSPSELFSELIGLLKELEGRSSIESLYEIEQQVLSRKPAGREVELGLREESIKGALSLFPSLRILIRILSQGRVFCQEKVEKAIGLFLALHSKLEGRELPLSELNLMDRIHKSVEASVDLLLRQIVHLISQFDRDWIKKELMELEEELKLVQGSELKLDDLVTLRCQATHGSIAYLFSLLHFLIDRFSQGNVKEEEKAKELIAKTIALSILDELPALLSVPIEIEFRSKQFFADGGN